MGRKVVGHHHVARPQGGVEHLVELGGEHVAVDGPAHAQQRPEAVGGERGDKHHVRAAVQGRGLVGPLFVFGAGVTTALREVSACFVHKLEVGETSGLHRRNEGYSQTPYPLGVALGGVVALFSSLIQCLHCPPQCGRAHNRSAQSGHPHARLVESGVGLPVSTAGARGLRNALCHRGE